MSPLIPPVVDRDTVESLRADGRDVLLCDVRWYLDGRDGRAAFEAAHVPGAVFVDLEAHLARHDLPATEGRHPFPSAEDFASSMSELGISDDTVVIAYDDSGGITAGRMVVMLRMLGCDAAVLDGGLQAWHPHETGPSPQRPPARFATTPWPADRFASADEVARAPGSTGVSIDARAHERFTGAVTMIDPRPGHIPGARNAPWDAVIDTETRRFLSPDHLRAHYAERGIGDDTDVIAYCGSGVSACMNLLAMERAGLPVPRLYVASFSGWSADPDRAVEQGDEETPGSQE